MCLRVNDRLQTIIHFFNVLIWVQIKWHRQKLLLFSFSFDGFSEMMWIELIQIWKHSSFFFVFKIIDWVDGSNWALVWHSQSISQLVQMSQIITLVFKIFEAEILPFLLDGVSYLFSGEGIENVLDFVSTKGSLLAIEYVVVVVIVTVLKFIQFPYLLAWWWQCCLIFMGVHAVRFVMSVWSLRWIYLWVKIGCSRYSPL